MPTEEEFIRAREEIGEIDRKIARLFEERMRRSDVIADYKRERALPIRDRERERFLIEKNAALIGDDRIRAVYPPVEEAVMAASRALQEDRGERDSFPDSFRSAGSRVLFRRGGAARLAEFFGTGKKTMIVTDSGVPKAWVRLVSSQFDGARVFTFPAGEDCKSLFTVEKLLSALLADGFTRGDRLLALGGGVVTDLTAFTAGIYLRGISCVSVPTTLLAQADASVGGKNGIDFGGIKNSVGLFRAPEKILIDPGLTETLDARQQANGIAEIVKMAVTLDEGLFGELEAGDGRVTDGILRRAIFLKKEIVDRDEKESGLRRVLNFGHTLGHGIEIAADGKLLHGEAVALGMLPMASPDVRKRLIALYRKIGLPVSFPYDPEKALAAMLRDKKSVDGGVTCVTVPKAGTCAFTVLDPSALGRLARGEAIV